MAKNPTLTKEQFDQLAPYEQHFLTAVNSRWSRNPGRHALEKMEEIWRNISYPGYRLDYNCSTCIVNILTDLGRIWLKMKAEKAAEKPADEAEAPKTAEPSPKPKKVATAKKKATTVKNKTVNTKEEAK